jgi:acetyltransferase-like isoleucine patch superfamily enzyme
VNSPGAKPPWPKSLLVAVLFFAYNALVTRVPFYFIRHLYLRLFLRIRMGRGASVAMGCFFTGRYVEIGDRAVINRNCRIDGRGGLRIGEDASISPECSLLSLTHDAQSPHFGVQAKPTVIGKRAWLGTRAMILPGVEVGDGAVVGAGSVVTKGCAPFEIVAGNPARKIGERNRDLQYSLRYFPLFDTDVQL